MKNFAPQTEPQPQPLPFPPPVQQRVDANSHNLNWYNQPTIEQFNQYPAPPAADMSMSLFDPSEQQFLSGFFDNLVEDKNEFILPTNLDFSALLSNWGGPSQFPEHEPKPHMQNYGLPPPHQPQHPYFHPHTGRPQLSSVGFHTPLTYPPPETHITHNYIQTNIKFQTPCDQLSSMSDSSSNKPPCNLNDPVSLPVYGNFNMDFQTVEEVQSSTKKNKPKRKPEEPQAAPTNQTPVKEEHRKANHIASEQKRRKIIRTGFEQLTEIVPCLKGNHSSKATILARAADYIEEIEKINRDLQKQKELLKGLTSSVTSSTTSFPLTPGRNINASL